MSPSAQNHPYLGGGILCPPHKIPMFHKGNFVWEHKISPILLRGILCGFPLCYLGGILYGDTNFLLCYIGEILCGDTKFPL